jgi:hypothetical protein
MRHLSHVGSHAVRLQSRKFDTDTLTYKNVLVDLPSHEIIRDMYEWGIERVDRFVANLSPQPRARAGLSSHRALRVTLDLQTEAMLGSTRYGLSVGVSDMLGLYLQRGQT